MNCSKLFLMMTLGVSLNNGACGMKQLKHDIKKISITDYNKAATQELQTLLNHAFDTLSEEKITELLTAGADPNIQNDDGSTPLYLAACNGHKEIVGKLLTAGAHPNIQDNEGYTPLYLAARNGHKEIVGKLLTAGSNLNRQNELGETPLHRASFWGRIEIVDMLLKHGAHLNIQDNEGDTPLHNAVYCGGKEVVEHIINFITNGAQIMNDNVKQLTYLCSRDETFRKNCQIFLMSNNRQPRSLKIPKLLCYEFLLRFWNPLQYITELVNTENEFGKTALGLAREKAKEEMVQLLEPYEKK